MKKHVALILGSALTALIAGTALAASAPVVDSPEAKPAAVAVPAVAPVTKAAPDAASAHAAVAAPTPIPKAVPDAAFKVGYVDMTKVASETKSGKAAAATLKAKSLKLRGKIEARQKQLEKQKAAIEAKLESMSPKERAAKGKEFQKKMEEYQKLVRASELEMQEMQEQLISDVYKSIKKAATEYGKSHGYAAVLAKKDTLYLADSLEPKDLTDEISAILDK